MDENNQNLDVWQMQEDLAAQATGGQQVYYDDSQAALTANRAAYGDVPAMMMTGIRSGGAAIAGAYTGAGNMLSAIGRTIRPATYTPPARVVSGQYGQYQQKTGLLSGLSGMMGYNSAPVGTNAYQYGYYQAADFGERVGAGAASVGTVAAGAFGGAPVGGMIGGAIGGIAGAAFGPAGAFVGAGLGNIAGSIAGYMGADLVGEAVAQRREMNAFLESSSFRYAGAGSSMSDPRIGGMNLAARRETTDFIKGMDVKDPSMGMEDLSKVLRESTQLGMFTGVSDVDTFKKKFKDIIDGVKSVTRVLGTSLEDGLKVMKDLKAINIDPSQVREVVTQADAVGKLTGRTGQEIVGLGLQGAELFRGTGIEAKIGYQSNVMNMAALRSARDAGILSQEAVIQAGGEEALAQRMTASGLGFVQSAAGRGFGAAFFNPATGPAGFDKAAFMQNAMSGGMGMEALATQAAMNQSDPTKVTAYKANQAKFMSEMGKTFGGMGNTIGIMNMAMANARMLYSSGAAANMTDAFRVSLQEAGQSESEIENMLAMSKNAPKAFADQVKGLNMTRNQQIVSNLMETRGLDYIGRRVSDEVSGAFEPLVGGISGFIDTTKQGAINIWEKKGMGITRVRTDDADYESLATNLGAAKSDLPNEAVINLDEGFSPLAKGAMVVSGGIMAGLAAAVALPALPFLAAAGGIAAGAGTTIGASSLFSFSQTSGQQIREALPRLKEFGLGDAVKKRKKDVLPGEVIIDDPSIIGDNDEAMVQVVKGDDLVKSIRSQSPLTVTSDQAKKMQEDKIIQPPSIKAQLKMADLSTQKDYYSPEERALKAKAQTSYVSRRKEDQELWPKIEKDYAAMEARHKAPTLVDYIKVVNPKITDLKTLTEEDVASFRVNAEELDRKGIHEPLALLNKYQEDQRVTAASLDQMSAKTIEGAQEKIDEAGSAVSSTFNKLNRNTIVNLALAQRIDDELKAMPLVAFPEKRAELEAKKEELFLKAFTSQDKDKSVFSKGFKSVTEAGEYFQDLISGKDTSSIIRGVVGSADTMAKMKSMLGLDQLADMAMADQDFKALPLKEKAQVKEELESLKIGGVEALLNLDEKSPLAALPAGRDIFKAKQAAETVEKIDKESRSKKLSHEETADAIKTGLKGTISDEAISKTVDAYNKTGGGVAAAQGAIFQQTTSALGKTEVVGGAGTAGKGTPAEQGSSSEVLAVQLGMFKNVQSALEGVANRLNAR